MSDLSSPSGRIWIGQLLFAACCIVYLIWWSVAFRPGYTALMAVKEVLFLITAALGIAGLAKILHGCSGSGSPVRFWHVIAAGAAVYITLLVLTNVLMHRQVTTELVLIIFWICMEICACGALCGEDVFSFRAFVVLTVIAVATAAAGMVCYLKYYELEPMMAFYDGMVPLILFALYMIGVAVYQVYCVRGS